MKYCGCDTCRRNGEINPREQFEVYLAQKEDEILKEFAEILSKPFSAAELNDLESEFFKSDVVNRIQDYSIPNNTFDAYQYWHKYGGSLRGFQKSS